MRAGSEETIEVEVIEIDGQAVDPDPFYGKKVNARGGIGWPALLDWAKRLDRRWWPLWLLLGFIALVLVVAVGMCVAVIFVTWQMLKAFFIGLVSLFNPRR